MPKDALRNQLEFYFGDANLSKDRFLKQCIDASPDGYVDVAVVAGFNRVRALTQVTEEIVAALRSSKLLEVSDDGLRVRRIKPVAIKEDAQACTVFVEPVPKDIDHSTVKAIFQEFGKVDYVSIPRFNNEERTVQGFAFVEFAKPKYASKALEAMHADSEVRKRVAHGLFEASEEKRTRAVVVLSMEDWKAKKKSDKEKRRLKQQKTKEHYEALRSAATSTPDAMAGSDTSKPDSGDKPAHSHPKERVLVALMHIPEKMTPKSLSSALSEFGDVAHVDFKKGSAVGTVRFASSKDAFEACKQLDAGDGTKGRLLTGMGLTALHAESHVYPQRKSTMLTGRPCLGALRSEKERDLDTAPTLLPATTATPKYLQGSWMARAERRERARTSNLALRMRVMQARQHPSRSARPATWRTRRLSEMQTPRPSHDRSVAVEGARREAVLQVQAQQTMLPLPMVSSSDSAPARALWCCPQID
eukprot:m.226046 g.226046  ORF g.226046 m.226046 type:complete len:474 (+) comp10838_c0_seq12:1217-2638(+)